MKKCCVVIFHNIRSAHNVGAMFRTAECAGVSKVFLTGHTPAPINRFGFPQKEVVKSALGAEALIPWESRKHIKPVIEHLKKDGYTIIALEQHADSVNYKKIHEQKIALIVGNEVTGVEPSVLTRAHYIAEIPLKGKKESLNVSTAFGIGLFALLRI
jgi:23S rRNA (guanosine2251-2'-O)-methyltransferase